MVVDGRDEFNGSDEAAARRVLAAAAARPHLPLRDRRARPRDGRAAVDRSARRARRRRADRRARRADRRRLDAPSCAAARTAVARSPTSPSFARCESLGSLEREAFVADGQLALIAAWKTGKMRAVAWLQGRRTRHVYGTAAAPLVQ